MGKLSAYAGTPGHANGGQSAYDYWFTHPVHITMQEALQIDTAVTSYNLARAVVQYDKATGTAGSFFELPSQAQTVVADAYFQMNCNVTKQPFWSSLVQGDWSSAIDTLNHMSDYKSRRAAEADLLAQALANGTLHNGSRC